MIFLVSGWSVLPTSITSRARLLLTFGAWGEGYLRFSIANSYENLGKGPHRRVPKQAGLLQTAQVS